MRTYLHVLCFGLFMILPSTYMACSSPECKQDSDCADAHDACTDGKCVHDHSKHQTESTTEHMHTDGGTHDDHAHDEDQHEHSTHEDMTEHPHTEKTTHESGNNHEHGLHDDEQKTADVYEACDTHTPCLQGLTCVTFGTAGSICLKKVSTCTSGACATAEVCATLENQPVCIKACSQASDCPTGSSCKHAHEITHSTDVCTP